MVDLLELYLAEHLQALVQLVGVEHGYIFLNIALTLEPLLPFEHGGRGQVYGLGQLLGGQFCILLQSSEYLQVCRV